jgi:hypothetical protein
MNKLEVQKRVTRNGEPLPLEKFEWDEKNRVFSSKETNLVLNFQWESDITFNASRDCQFIADSNCYFNTGYGCRFTTLGHCNFFTDNCCHFDTGPHCVFKTGLSCDFSTSSFCRFETGGRCTFKTGPGCKFNVDEECTIISWWGYEKIILQPEAGDFIQFFYLVVDNVPKEQAYREKLSN